MSTYPNGKIPDHLLIRRGDFLLTAGTWAKFDDLVARVKERTGVTLRISTGSTPITRGAGAFRTYAVQVLVKAYWVARGQGKMAATPGTSSHGGEFKGRDALAIDINNYTQIPLSVFFEEGRKAGFEMGYFDGRNGRPYEPWHIIDREPYRKVAPTGGNSKPVPKPVPKPEEKELDIVSNIRYVHRVEKGYSPEWMIVGMEVPGGFKVTGDQTTAEGWGAIYGTDKGDSWKALNRKQYIALQASAAALHKEWLDMQRGIQK